MKETASYPKNGSEIANDLSLRLHDLRTPLNHIIGLGEMLMEISEENGDHELLRDLGAVRNAAVEIASLLQDRNRICEESKCGPGARLLIGVTQHPIDLALEAVDRVRDAVQRIDSGRRGLYLNDLRAIGAAAVNFMTLAKESRLCIRDAGLPAEATMLVPSSAKAQTGCGRVLVVDDEPLNRELLCRRLQREGYQAAEAASGQEALEYLHERPCDIVLLDIQMPGINGMELLQLLKGDQELRKLSVIMLSALAEVDRVARCIELGAEDYLPKPINSVLLRARLGACMEKKRLRDREQAMTEELLRASKLQSIGELAGGLAHDFNNMLTAVMGNLSLVRYRRNLPPDLLPPVLEAERAAVRAQELTRYLLTFSEGGAPVKQMIELGSLIVETCEFVVRGSPVACNYAIAGDLWDAEADPHQFNQVLSSLISNSVEAMPNGGSIVVRAENIRATSADSIIAPGDYVRISIRDSGPGIPKENLSRIFDPFFTTKEQARGLGLAAAYSIIRKHRGYIDIKSPDSGGVIATIYLPAASAGAPAEDIRTDVEPPEDFERLNTPKEPKERRPRVLVMDDEDAIRLLAETMLTMLGFDVLTVEDGNAALAAHAEAQAQGEPFDLAVMDLTIPGGMGGRETIQRLRERDNRIQAIVSSGYSNDPVMSDHDTFGFNAVLPKPYMFDDLVRVIRGLPLPAEALRF